VGPWETFYRGDLQGLWSLVVAPALFLLALPWLRPRAMGADPRAAGFVHGWAVAFALETIVDPVAVGVGGVSMVPFVLLGDFRVFLLLLGVLEPEQPLARTFARAAAWTLVVPVLALSLYRLARGISGPLPEQALWLIYECAFVALALWWRARVARVRPRAERFLRTVLAYVATYYGLWAVADVLIMAGRDVGWAVRVIPNQLYYGLWVPVVWVLFFSPRYASTSMSVQTRR